MKGFKDFLMRGNLIELAVAFIMGTAFGAVVTTFTAVILAAIGRLIGGASFNWTSWAPGGIPLGAFLTALVAFIIMAAVVYFLIVKPMEMYRARKGEAAPKDTEVDLLAQIRDLLKSQSAAQ